MGRMPSFASPAQDYKEPELDLNELCIRHRSATFFFHASSNSFTDSDIKDGDVLVIDRAETANHGDTVIAIINGEYVVKVLLVRPRLALQAMNADHPTVYPEPDELEIFGVVTWFLHAARRG